jgi:phenylalanyl-tRNA synthetase beta chain
MQICGGEPVLFSYCGSDQGKKASVQVTTSLLSAKSNINFKIDEIKLILSNLGFVFKQVNDDIFEVEVPSWRHDISSQEDILEEILRIHGYDNIPEVPFISKNNTSSVREDFANISKLKHAMSASGYDELVTWSFMDSSLVESFGELNRELLLLSPISRELDCLRPTIIPNLIAAILKNKNRSYKNLNFFEIGPIFKSASVDGSSLSLAAIRDGDAIEHSAHENSRAVDVFDVKSDIFYVLENLDIDTSSVTVEKNELPIYYHPGCSGRLVFMGQTIGYFGEIHPFVIKKFDMTSMLHGFELNLPLILEIQKISHKNRLEGKYTPSLYQTVERDFAFIVHKDQEVGKMISEIQAIDRGLIKSIDVFDIYTGEKVPENYKSVAFSLQFKNDIKTLNDQEIKGISDIIIETCSKKFSAKIRSE